MSPVYLNLPPSSSTIAPFLESKGDQHTSLALGQIHDHLATSNNPSLSYDPSSDKNLAYYSDGSCLTIGYSRHAQDNKVEDFWSHDKPNDLGQVFNSSPWPESSRDGSGCSYGYSSNHGGHQEYKNHEETTITNNNDLKNSKKWKPSKVRIMQKMIATTSKNIGGEHKPRHDHLEKRQGSLYRSNSDNNNGGAVRVCSDCHTTTTPLWRSGPRGPKSLCNACGIRQRKARRAAMAAAAAAAEVDNGMSVAPIPMEEPMPKVIEVKERGSLDHHHHNNSTHPLPLKKRGKTVDFASHYNNFYNNNGVNSSNNPSRSFPRDEEEGAILLMALSCGLACSS